MKSITRLAAVSHLCVGLSVMLLASACVAPTETVALAPGSVTAVASPFRSAAFVIDVNTRRLSATVSPPLGGALRNAWSPSALATVAVGASGAAQFSILGSDAVDIAISNLVSGPIGASVAGKILLTFDLTIIGKLNGVRLTTPTFPTPPRGVTGVQAFPFELSVVTTQGGVGSAGNELIVTAPRFGSVIASNDWDGAPHNFFNDANCSSGSNDCFRYEPFGDIAPRAASAPRRVGFLIDPTVGDIRVRLLVAADIRIE
jgi:hypothetical protein